MVLLVIILFIIQVLKHDYYLDKLNKSLSNIIYEDDALRGRIYDTKGRIIVDNEDVINVVYRKMNNINYKEELAIAYKLADLLDIDFANLTKTDLKEFWILQNYDLSKTLITKNEYELYEERKIDNNDLMKLKLYRISDDDIAYSDYDKEAYYI